MRRSHAGQCNRGVALILALLVLSFLTILGSALLTTATIDIWISDNYKTATQNLYLTEAAIDHARDALRVSTSTATELLATAAGGDGQLATSSDLTALLASDDQPLIPADPALRSRGQPLVDSTGKIMGRYYVWLRSADNNGVLTLLGIGLIGNTRKVIEVTIEKGRIPDLRESDSQVDPRLTTVAGLEGLAARITKYAADIYNPIAQPQSITDYGSATNYRVAVVNGDVNLGPGSGYGILLVRGGVRVVGHFSWNGLILIIGQGAMSWAGGTTGIIHGGMFIARTRAADGSMLAAPGDTAGDLSPAAIFYDAAAIRAANQSFPYNPIAIRER